MANKKPTFEINGRVVDMNSGRGIAGLRVEAWDKDLIINDLVGGAVTDADGRFVIEFTRSYFRELFYDRYPDLFFKVFSDKELIKSTEDSVIWNARAGLTTVEIPVPWSSEQSRGRIVYRVEGTVASPDRAGVGGLRVEIVDKNVGHDDLVVETTTNERGRYSVNFSSAAIPNREKQRPDLQARVYAKKEFLAASEVRYNAGEQSTLDVNLPAASRALASEYETLTAALAAHFDGHLRDLKESDERQDITYLANKTGWDARAVALAALADQFSRHSLDQKGVPEIKPAFYYALFRAGLPANPDMLYHAAPHTVDRIFRDCIDQGVVPSATDSEIGKAVEAFQRLSAEKLLTGPALIGASLMKEMLAVSGLDDKQQQKFAQLYAAHRVDLRKFWDEVGKAFGAEKSARLQLDGKLAILTINNAALMTELHKIAGEDGLTDPIMLAQKGYHRADNWNQLVANVAVPKEIPGDTTEDKRKNYAAYLAAQVRLSYPTASVAEMVGSGDLKVSEPDKVRSFLNEHQAKSGSEKFELGMMPVGQYVARNKLNVDAAVLHEVKRIERVYQITSSDTAMIGLLSRDVDSAAQVVRFEKETFETTFADALGGAESARQTYDKSLQVHNAVLNILVSYVTAQNGISIGAGQLQTELVEAREEAQILRPKPKGGSADNAGDVIAYATLEGLFGAMDFCACDHCRSILSPAAYLVDLLQFIDQTPTEAGKENPQAVLLERRPDVQHLPLTCENTNTALPYIDVVNETLEYFIANLALTNYKGYDTGKAASEDLLASPQFVLEGVYTTLSGERFPTLFPFHQPLEHLRRYFDKFEVPLPLAMEILRPNNDLERGLNSYGWRDILIEELRISRDEYEVLTDSVANPLWRIYGFPDGTADTAVINVLSNAREFTRRVGISYEDIVAILRTRFVNPNSDLIPKLERLGVRFAVLQALKEGPLSDDDFDELLPKGAGAPDARQYRGDIKAWVRRQENYDRIMHIITLADSTIKDDPCSFDTLEFRYSQPKADVNDTSNLLGTVEFVRVLRFIRLWKKLGWTIEQTDAAICALLPGLPIPPGPDALANLDAGFRTLLLNLGVAVRVMAALNLTPKRDLLSLLACWSPLGIHGNGALYRQLFLSPAIRAQDATFGDNGYGEFLLDNTQKILGHAAALRAAFGLTDAEFSQIVVALGFDADFVTVPYEHPQPALEQTILDNAPGIGYDHANGRLSYTGALSAAARDALRGLAGVSETFRTAVNDLYAANQITLATLTLDRISAIYRHGWLARKMKLSVRELLLLIEVTGLDPFAAPDPTSPAILRLFEFVQAMEEKSLKPTAALYLVWNQDLSGTSGPGVSQVSEFARTLRISLAGIDNEFTEDPTGEIAQARMTLAYGQQSADFFFGLLNGSFTSETVYTHFAQEFGPALATALQAAAGSTGDPAVSRITYNDYRKQLTFTGVLSAQTRDAIRAVATDPAVVAEVPQVPPGLLAAFQTDFPLALNALYARNNEAVLPFFARYAELLPLYTDFVTSTDPLPQRRGDLLSRFLPDLILRRKQEQVLQAVADAAQTDRAFAGALLNPSQIARGLHAATDSNQGAINDLLALQSAGLSAQFFDQDTNNSDVEIPHPAVILAANLDYAPATSNALPPNGTNPGDIISGVWSGRIEGPTTGLFNFIIETDEGATVSLSIDGREVPLTQNLRVWRNAQPLPLQGGTLTAIEISVGTVRNRLNVQWETTGQGRQTIGARYLYPSTQWDAAQAVYLRFLKATALVTALGLSAAEVARPVLVTDGPTWLNDLPIAGDSLAPADLYPPLRDLLDYSRIKADLSPGDDRLSILLDDPVAASAGVDGADSLLATLTRWDVPSLNHLLVRFAVNLAELSQMHQFRRVYDAFALIRKMGISASALARATTNNPTGDTVGDLQAALRARYEAADWRSVIQPINDQMRALQRDALVAYILHWMNSQPSLRHIDTVDKLFEYFLMDVQMEPCMQTSRIRHALSSVQLFIERCLMNLEPRASLASDKTKQWEWMKRYRVWETNRKVFLYPENWLEPELRDNKSPFFKEVESELLQSDITEDTAAVALLNYLAKLAEVSKLEPCGIYHTPADSQRGISEINHVVARTAGAGRKYYYRRREYGYWTPWEQIKLDIEDNPVIPVVWNNRLLLFWLRILKQSPVDPDNLPESPDTGVGVGSLTLSTLKADAKTTAKSNAKVTVQAVLCWSEYYNGKWQPMKTSDLDRPEELGKFAPTAFDRSQVRLSSFRVLSSRADDAPLGIGIDIGNERKGTLLLYNTHSLPLRLADAAPLGKSIPLPSRAFSVESDILVIKYIYPSDPYDPSWVKGALPPSTLPPIDQPVLQNRIKDRAIATRHGLRDEWVAPFFYEDSRHVFYVTTDHVEVPVRDQPDVGIYPGMIAIREIPPLIVREVKPLPKSDVEPVPGIYETNPDTVWGLISEDANIRQAISAIGDVKFDGVTIGLLGSRTRGTNKV